MYIELLNDARGMISDFGRGITYGRALCYYLDGKIELFELKSIENIVFALNRGVKA